MGDDGLENWGYFTRPSMIWDQITWLWVSAPTWSVQRDLCALLWFYTGYVRLCYEKGAMSSCWKYVGFCGYFSFLSRLSFWLFSGILSVVELLCIPGEIMLASPVSFDLTVWVWQVIISVVACWIILASTYLIIAQRPKIMFKGFETNN